MTPEEREVIERRIAAIEAEMEAMDALSLDSWKLARWAELYQERNALKLQLENE